MATIQNSDRLLVKWAETVFCFIGNQDEHFKKTEGKIGKTQAFSKESHLHRSCPKRTLARTHRDFHRRDAGLHREGNSHRMLCTNRYSIYLLLPLAVGPKIICRTPFVHLHISELTPGPSGTQRQTTPGTCQSRQPGTKKHSSGAATAGR